MEFFSVFTASFQFSYPDIVNYGIDPIHPYIALFVAAGAFVLLYVFKAIGLFTMAKKQGKINLLWCAFVPFASTYLMGELAGEWRIGKARVKHIGLYAMLGELVYCALAAFVSGVLVYAFANGMTETYPLEDVSGAITPYVGWRFTAALPDALYTACNVCNVLATVFQYVQLVLFVFLYIAFFRRYAPASYVWMVVICALLPVVTPFLVFAFRGRVPVDYDRFMQERVERMRRAQQAQYGPYGPYGRGGYGQSGPYGQNDPYGQSGPYGQNGYGQSGSGAGSGQEPADPFGEFGSGGKGQGSDDPFGEFSDPDKKDGGAH